MYMPDRNGCAMRLFPVSRHGSDVVGCAQPSERSARRIACPYRAVLASDATPRCASMASADRQMIGDATPGLGLASRASVRRRARAIAGRHAQPHGARGGCAQGQSVPVSTKSHANRPGPTARRWTAASSPRRRAR
ncbi:hypothetical protein D8B30_09205 [Verminephrobacter eiseniae]|nr:hypothetical protein [Verminephrobacter eiseniae]